MSQGDGRLIVGLLPIALPAPIQAQTLQMPPLQPYNLQNPVKWIPLYCKKVSSEEKRSKV